MTFVIKEKEMLKLECWESVENPRKTFCCTHIKMQHIMRVVTIIMKHYEYEWFRVLQKELG